MAFTPSGFPEAVGWEVLGNVTSEPGSRNPLRQPDAQAHCKLDVTDPTPPPSTQARRRCLEAAHPPFFSCKLRPGGPCQGSGNPAWDSFGPGSPTPAPGPPWAPQPCFLGQLEAKCLPRDEVRLAGFYPWGGRGGR